MLHDTPAEVVSFERFLERRQRLAPALPPTEIAAPPAPADPAQPARREREPRTTRTMAVACPIPGRTTTP